MVDLRRRRFLTLLGAAAVAWPLASRAQQPRKIPRIGVLWHAGSAEEEGSNFKALVKGFSDLGYVEVARSSSNIASPMRPPSAFAAWPPSWWHPASMS